MNSSNNGAYIGQYRNSVPHGLGLACMHFDSVCIARFQQGSLAGPVYLFDRIGHEAYYKTAADIATAGIARHVFLKDNITIYGPYDGQGVIDYNNGCVYKGELKHGRATGVGVRKERCGCFYEGSFSNSQLDGHGVWDTRVNCRGQSVYPTTTFKGCGFDFKAYSGIPVVVAGQYTGMVTSNQRDQWARYVDSSGVTHVSYWQAGLPRSLPTDAATAAKKVEEGM